MCSCQLMVDENLLGGSKSPMTEEESRFIEKAFLALTSCAHAPKGGGDAATRPLGQPVTSTSEISGVKAILPSVRS